MNCVLFAGMNQVFSLKKKHKHNIEKYWKREKNTGKVPDLIAMKDAS